MSLAWKKSAIAMVAAGMLVGSLAACSTERDSGTDAGGGDDEGTFVGIAMPTKSLERWNRDGSHLEGLLEEAGYETSLQYADNKVDQQITQLENMINQGADVLVIAPIDDTALAPTLQQAADADITVIAYDRLLLGTPNVDYYATFDNYSVGTMQGEYIVDALDLEGGAGPFNLEPFAGSPDDNNAKFFFAGAWDILSEYVDSGQLVVPSGKAPATNDDWKSIGVEGWKTDTAQAEMEIRLNSFYASGTKVDVVLSPNDSLALGIAQALAGNGYAPGAEYPIVTGQDADKANVLNLIEGKQSMTVWKDTRTLGDQVAVMIKQIVAGDTVEVNDEKTYDNGEKVVPTYLLPPQVVTPDSVDVLVESGFYKAADLGL
ncbi:substrate-binding domain-containing protein [Cellulomonas xiejunii]|uniref:Sugar ABC transporter substrate-binding protein n=1 Tax=Cellulomonas xiejunii TaxID=2968083 RepID=A0ABY5KNC8_9CELL|nr:sugar-binding protein [Cellulomonas xiejunii]MCC2312774.1 sugar-binding protein [Cellulomonas xiejunii]MCC2320356.1 sugar-binding protein [Cellulomonas xiejunii]UUI70656.1 sugar ABC transporter substrate-binding protein [Cellulomonas xiejunii]